MVGFPFLAVAANSLGLSSTLFSIIFRGLTASIAMLIILRTSARRSWGITVFLFFWAVYFCRVSVESLLNPTDLYHPVSFYWIWGVGVCFLPALCALSYRHADEVKNLQKHLGIIGVLACFLLLVNGSTSMMFANGDIVDIERLNSTSLNPISAGHLGVTTALVGICSVLIGSKSRLSAAFWVLVIGIGVSLALMANSRGPIVAFMACMAFIFLAKAHRKRTYIISALFLIFAIYFSFSKSGVDTLNLSAVANRFGASVSAEDASSTGRLLAYKGAVSQFLESPIIGDALEEKSTGFYPHNIILEAFMATGLVGGIPFVVMLFAVARRAHWHIKVNSQYSWAAILVVQYIVGAMFSGAIYNVGTMWILIGIMLSPSLSRKKSKKNRVMHGYPHPSAPFDYCE